LFVCFTFLLSFLSFFFFFSKINKTTKFPEINYIYIYVQ
jgi:hypothetical protein